MPVTFGRLEIAFIALMLLAGAVTAMVVGRNPGWGDAPVPAVLWPVMASFVFDLATLAWKRGGPPPLVMPVRAAGVVAGMVLYIVLVGRI